MSLLRTAARASVATRVIGNTHRRQQQRWAAQDAAAAPVPTPELVQTTLPVAESQAARASAPTMVSSAVEQLTQLGHLRDAGIITEIEFETLKQRALSAG